MTSTEFDVVGVGNAIVDVLTHVSESFITQHGLNKGAMTLIDETRAIELYDAMPPGLEMSGGSAANTIAGVASFGGRAAYIGRCRADQLGEVFRHDLRALGVSYDVPLAGDGPATARCLIQVTPDAQRTMNTYLGASSLLSPRDVDLDVVRQGAILYCEGYLWDMDDAKRAMRGAMDAARDAGRRVALTLSDSFCVDRHRAEWLALLDERVDIVFANEAEVCSLYETDWTKASARIAHHVEIACLTRSAAGSVIVAGGERHAIPAAPAEVVDTTGAGDLYAAGFLFGLARGFDLPRCGQLAARAAAEVISHPGARPLVPLATLAD